MNDDQAIIRQAKRKFRNGAEAETVYAFMVDRGIPPEEAQTQLDGFMVASKKIKHWIVWCGLLLAVLGYGGLTALWFTMDFSWLLSNLVWLVILLILGKIGLFLFWNGLWF